MIEAKHSRIPPAHTQSHTLTTAWFGLGGPLQIIIFIVCSWQAYWALANMVTLAQGSTTNTVITGTIAVSLILGRNVLAVRLPTMSWAQWIPAGLALALCMAFSVITSQLHLAQQVQGGHVASIQSSAQYQDADARYRKAVANADRADANIAAAEREIKIATDQGDIASAGHLRRGLKSAERRITAADQRVERARQQLAAVASSGQAGVAATIVTETAQHLRLTPEQFAVALSTLAAFLLELVGVLLAWYDGNQLRRSPKDHTMDPRQAAPVAA